MDEMDFPSAPAVGDVYVNSVGVAYEWDGVAWVVGLADTNTSQLKTLGDLLSQIRILLMDTDNRSGSYRYSTQSIVLAINQCMMDFFRLRPDVFLEQGFVVPLFDPGVLSTELGIEPQYVSPVVYYAVGLVQARDDEQNQDSRASAFLKSFTQNLMSLQ